MSKPKKTEGSTTPPASKPPRVVKRVDPFSPWQVMVEDRREELGLGTRALAKKIETPTQKLEHTTIWAWLRHPDGVPPVETYNRAMNDRLAKALEIGPEILAKAYEDSRQKLISDSSLATQMGPLGVLRMLFADSKRDSYTPAEIVEVIDKLRGH